VTEFRDHPRIEIDPSVMLGKPVIAGTRVTVEAVLDTLAHAQRMEDVFEAFPGLTQEDVSAALAFAAEHMRAGVVAAE
jgi:uncharacterized protein (DUF433 family)